MDTEALAIIVPSIVAVAAVGLTWDQHRRGLRHERELSDLGPVREVFDESAVLLHRIAYDLDDVRSYLTQHGGVSFFKTEKGTEVYKLLGEHGKNADVLYERLSVRLRRDHAAVVHFKAANVAVLSIWRAVGLLRRKPEANGHESAARQIAVLNAEKRAQIEADRATFDTSRDRFIAAAQRAAGARLRSADGETSKTSP